MNATTPRATGNRSNSSPNILGHAGGSRNRAIYNRGCLVVVADQATNPLATGKPSLESGRHHLSSRLLSFEFLDPLFDRFLIEAPVRAHLKGGNSLFF